MKKKIGYVCLIIISVLGSRLIFGKDYHLNSNNLIDNNMYLYDIFDKKDTNIVMVDNEYLYYVLSSNKQYTLVKYNLISDKISSENSFNSNIDLKDIKLIRKENYLYLTAINSNVYYQYNMNLELINQVVIDNNYDSYGILTNEFITTNSNQIIKNDIVYEVLPNSCGNNREVIYYKDTYLHFHNTDTGFGCLYNINTKKREYLDYEKVAIINNRLLEYQDNRISFKYDNNTYYFNDITESNNLVMHENGDYLFTIDMTSNMLKIYNLETKKNIYERTMIELNNGKIKDILIDDYAYFTVVKDDTTKLYIWDYLKETRKNKNMISYNDKEYKFKNNELKEEIKDKYNIDVYIYDQAVTYFTEAYVIPSYDDILINSRLNILKDVLISQNLNNFKSIKICLEKNIVSKDGSNTIDTIVTNKDDEVILAIDITDDDFKTILIDKLNTINPRISDISEIMN